MSESNESKEITVIDTENVNDVLSEIDQAFFDIPFENSTFQNEYFVLGSQITPERAYRSLGLRMHSKIRALNEAKYGRLKEEIDIDELKAKIEDPDTSIWDKRRAELDIQQRIENRPFTEKLINDALTELNILYDYFKKMPKYTREQFESAEQNHFQHKLQRQLEGVVGAKESLINMQYDLAAIMKTAEDQIKLGNYSTDLPQLEQK